MQEINSRKFDVAGKKKFKEIRWVKERRKGIQRKHTKKWIKFEGSSDKNSNKIGECARKQKLLKPQWQKLGFFKLLP